MTATTHSVPSSYALILLSLDPETKKILVAAGFLKTIRNRCTHSIIRAIKQYSLLLSSFISQSASLQKISNMALSQKNHCHKLRTHIEMQHHEYSADDESDEKKQLSKLEDQTIAHQKELNEIHHTLLDSMKQISTQYLQQIQTLNDNMREDYLPSILTDSSIKLSDDHAELIKERALSLNTGLIINSCAERGVTLNKEWGHFSTSYALALHLSQGVLSSTINRTIRIPEAITQLDDQFRKKQQAISNAITPSTDQGTSYEKLEKIKNELQRIDDLDHEYTQHKAGPTA